MSLSCPNCNSPHSVSSKQGLRAGALLGASAGMAQGICTALLSENNTDSIAGQLSLTAAAVLGGMAAGLTGCIIGAQFGDSIDCHVLANRQCSVCGHRFCAAP